MKIFVLFFLVLGLISTASFATPLTKEQQAKIAGNTTLRDQMGKMIISIADLDIIVNRDKTADFEIFKEDAERILKSIKEIEALDKEGVYKDFLTKLKEPTEKLLEYSILKNKKAMEYPEKIFNACFECHKTTRGY